MESKDLRQLFLDFFKQKEHEIVASSNLLPKDDPTLLFTNAGMVQFKSVFLGDETKPYKRAVTVQKCLRAGGKHNDLENVGRTARHHTFFEMLGNFSFGDYFKEDACKWGWEFLTEWVKLPDEKLFVTIFDDDDEAAEIWENHVGLPPEKIFRLGEKDNFWQMGDTGPCGPCSEIHIDQGPEMGCDSPDCKVGCDCDRYLEIWNLVFMQYNRDAKGKLTPLPKPSIDTGMGLERLAAVMQGKKNNFDTDLFMPIIKYVEKLSGKKYHKDAATDVSMRVIADHIRTSAFVLAEGLMPSNEGRGYVLRRIIRRAARHGLMLGIKGTFMHKVLDPVYEIMSDAYPELLDSLEMSRKVLRLEEERFANTLSSGMDILDKVISDVKTSGKDLIPGAELFKLYDTYGFPLDLAQDIAEDSGLKIDEEGFSKEMELQKTKARASWTGAAEDEAAVIYRDIHKESGTTEFLGYDSLQADGSIVAIIKKGKSVDEANEGDEVEVILDRTPFYGESGGQAGDSGIIKADGIRLEISDTKKSHNLMLHAAKVIKGNIKPGSAVTAAVDEASRSAIKRNHTSTHLLHAALKEVLGDHIKQAGSHVASDRLRFDFNHFFALNDREMSEVEKIVNEKVIENMPVDVSETSLDDAISKGVVALFGEKYGEKVRVVKAGEYSSELCGGTHCNATGDIGPFKITSEGSVASGIRRIEALTGFAALAYINEEERELKKTAEMLKATPMKLSDKAQKLVSDIKKLEKELEKARSSSASQDMGDVLDKVSDINGVKVLAHKIDGLDMKTLRDLVDKLKDKLGSGIVLLGSSHNGQASYVSAVTKDLTGRFNAGNILKKVTGGKGGGRADMAQGGTKDIAGIDIAISSVIDIIKEEDN